MDDVQETPEDDTDVNLIKVVESRTASESDLDLVCANHASSNDDKEIVRGTRRKRKEREDVVLETQHCAETVNVDEEKQQRKPPLLRVKEHYAVEDRKEFLQVLASSSRNHPHHGILLARACKELRRDKQVVLEACNKDGGMSLECASKRLRGDKDVVLAACEWDDSGFALKFASSKLRANKEVVLHACRYNGGALAHTSQELRRDRDCALAACKDDGEAIKFASAKLRDDKEVVLTACRQTGEALRYSSDKLRADKDCVLAAAATTPEALRYALGGLNQDRDCLIAAKLWDKNPPDQEQRHPVHPQQPQSKAAAGEDEAAVAIRITLSTKFSLSIDSSPVATKFTVLLKEHPFVRDGITAGALTVYSPNAFSKGTCDPEWTRLEWRCRGTAETCQKVLIDSETGVPRDKCCWRYSFRYQLLESRKTNGFMIQVMEMVENSFDCNLGKGQLIESELAKAVGVKVFRVHQPIANYNGEFKTINFQESDIDAVVRQINNWYRRGCEDMKVQEIPLVHFLSVDSNREDFDH